MSQGMSGDTVMIDGHEAVDMGGSVYWATMNVGASNTSEDGNLFVWGDPTVRESNFFNYPGYSGGYYTLEYNQWWAEKYSQIRYIDASAVYVETNEGYDTSVYIYKYVTANYPISFLDRSYSMTSEEISNIQFYINPGTVDYKNTLESIDDPANVHWGGGWRTPTYNEFLELKRNCYSISYGTSRDIYYQEVTGTYWISNINNNMIFLPNTNYMSSNVVSGTSTYQKWNTDTNSNVFFTFGMYDTIFGLSGHYTNTDTQISSTISISGQNRLSLYKVRPVHSK